MTDAPSSLPSPARRSGAFPVRRIGIAAISSALQRGWEDLWAAPAYGLAFGAVYALGGLLLLANLTVFGIMYLAYPLAAGFLILGPFVAVGLYDVSRRREAGLPLSWPIVLDAAFRTGARKLGWMPMLTLFAFMIWLDVAVVIYALFFGLRAMPVGELLMEIFATPNGLLFLLTGHAVGAVFAGFIYAAGVVGYPLLVARDCDFITAIATSVSAVTTNPVPMAAYALTVVALVAAALLPACLGLVVVLPWLGHATWHLHRAVVAAD